MRLISTLDYGDEECEGTSVNYYYIPRRLNQFHDVETAGSHIDYRCITHRECVDCKNSEHLETISIKEEVEQDLISKSVHIDIDKSEGHASFPQGVSSDSRLPMKIVRMLGGMPWYCNPPLL